MKCQSLFTDGGGGGWIWGRGRVNVTNLLLPDFVCILRVKPVCLN